MTKYLYYFMLECITPRFPHSDTCVVLYWCLAYIRDGTIALRMYVVVASPYLPGSGVTGWYQSLGSHTFSTASLQINIGLICDWVTRVFVIYSNHKYKVIYSFLEIHPLTSEISYSVIFLVDSNMERRGTRNGPDTSREGPYGENDMMRIL